MWEPRSGFLLSKLTLKRTSSEALWTDSLASLEKPIQRSPSQRKIRMNKQIPQSSQKASPLDEIRRKYVAKGKRGKVLAKREVAALLGAYKKARREHEGLLRKVEKAKERERQAAIRIMVNLGVQSYVIDGVKCEPWCRGDRVFFRRYDKPKKEPVKL